MMRVANIVICHQYPDLVERMIRSMDHQGFDFYVHVDKKVNIDLFNSIAAFPRVYFVKDRVPVRWAGYSQLEAITASLGQLLSGEIKYDFINLMSGQDYPIKPASVIYDFFNAHKGYSFLSSETPPSAWWDDARQRFTKYHFTDYGFPGKHKLQFFVNAILPSRHFPLDLPLYGGPYASYWTISYEAAVYLWNALKKHDKNRLFFKHTWGPDEFLVNTLLQNAPFNNKIINNNYRYFERLQGNAHPDVLTCGDIDILRSSEKLFARKFDPQIDPDVLDLVDQMILPAGK